MKRKRLGLLVAASALGLLVYLLLRPTPVRVEVAAAVRGPMQVTVNEEGRTRVRERYLVAAPVSGRLERITLEEGYPVEPGSVVARMHPLPLDPRAHAQAQARLEGAQASRLEAQARVEQARAALVQAERDQERARDLYRQGTISKTELETAELEAATRRQTLEAAKFAARAAEFEEAAARAALLATEAGTAVQGDSEALVSIRSPVEGEVLRLFEKSERVVELGTALMELGDPGALEIVVDVLSEDAVTIEAGAPVIVEDWGGEGELAARVRLVEPSGFTKVSALGVEEQRVNVIADFLGGADGLGDGYRVEVRIVVWSDADVLKVPSSALFRSGEAWNVFVVQDARARRRPIREGHRNAFEVEVLDGLREGELVILHPSDLVEDGVRVEISNRGR